jgi:hypothetical protein
MGIFRTNDPTQFDDIDGIIIDEQAPPPAINGIAANVGILVGQFQRGPTELSLAMGSIGEFHEIYGKSAFSGNKQLKNKKFGQLKIIRAVAAAAVKATKAFQSSATDRITFTAKYLGAYGNNIKVTIAAGSTSGKKYTIQDTNVDAVLPTEVYDNVVITAITSSTFAASLLVDVTVNSTAAEPSDVAATSLATGADGTIADTDYETAIEKAGVEKAGNVLFLDSYNSAKNGYLEVHAATYQDKMCILCGPEVQTRASAITDVANYRDTDGRLIYAWPYVQTRIDGLLEYTPPAAWIASIFTQISPHIALSWTQNAKYLGGITDLKYKESRNGYIALDAAGICSLELDLDIGFLVKNAVTTQIANSSKRTILRRRMADFLQDSIAYFLKNYQNDVNSKEKRTEVKSAILDFDTRLVLDGIVPGAQDVKDGAPVLVDTESLNTDNVVASGMFKILYKRRIFSSMRYIVLTAEIGESVVVTEGE